MLKLGIVGTNIISESFYDAAKRTNKYEVVAVFSRKRETGEIFAQNKPGVKPHDNWQEFLKLPLDVVYIATPNSVHYRQAMDCLNHDKHIIVEKPAFSTPEEMEDVVHLANKKRKMYFEAARHIYEPAFEALKEKIPTLNKITGANFTYGKYSTRYDAVLKGELPNIFSPHFSGGALMDLGVYLVYTALSLFGLPKEVHYYPTMIATGVDGKGTAILKYDDFQVVLNTSKIDDSFLVSEIYGENCTLTIPHVEKITYMDAFHRKNRQSTRQDFPQVENSMVYEAQAFANMMLNPSDPSLGEDYEELVELSRNVNLILTKLRKSADILFAADEK